MPLARYSTSADPEPRLGVIADDRLVPMPTDRGPQSMLDAFAFSSADLQAAVASARTDAANALPLTDVVLHAPIDAQEVWASGVTYSRSRDARMEESTQKDVYDLVYEADRPELFLKATPNRVSGPDEVVAIRGDSTWDVPEPELALAINTHSEVIGYTVGNDVSSRSIEGENPLYLPQAKVYNACAGLGPWITLTSELPDPGNLDITLIIERDGATNFEGQTSTSQIHRTFEDLVHYLHRHNTFPHGVFLMTGTGIIPPLEFTLEDGDIVRITVAGIGTLRNPVVRLDD